MNRKKLKTEPTKGIVALLDANMQQFEDTKVHKKTCWQRIWEILQRENTKPIMFQERTSLDQRIYYKAKNNDESIPDRYTIMAIAVGYNIGIDDAKMLLASAGYTFISTEKEHHLHIFILTFMHEYNIDVVNTILHEQNFRTLGSQSRTWAKAN